MNEDLTKFLLARISALENQNRVLKNSNLVKTELIDTLKIAVDNKTKQMEALRYELNYSRNTKKI